jgi:hypothetical protein
MSRLRRLFMSSCFKSRTGGSGADEGVRPTGLHYYG